MAFFSWLASAIGKRQSANGGGLRNPKTGSRKPPRFRPQLEALEDRMLPSTYSVATTSDLIADINAANKAGGANTIVLTAPPSSPYVLTAVNNTTDGANGLPQISKKDSLTIVGNGDTIERSTAAETPDFRLFDVAGGGALTLQNLTLQNGLVFGSGAGADGGAIYNHGTLTLSGVAVQNNLARGIDGTVLATKASAAAGGDAAGGGIWSGGTLYLQDLTLPGGTVLHTVLQYNEALGGTGGSVGLTEEGTGGQALGGALYLTGGNAGKTNATLTNVGLLNNLAEGGTGGNDGTGNANGGTGGAAFGGAVDIAEAGAVIVTGGTLENNEAVGGVGGYGLQERDESQGMGGDASGGAVCVTSGTVSMEGMFFEFNIAQGGAGGVNPYGPNDFNLIQGGGGNAYGGALFVGGGQVTVRSTTVEYNEALGGQSGVGFISGGSGGAIFIASGATLYLDSLTVANTIGNYPSPIVGTYILLA
jgi:hypothetical protein